MNKKLKNLLVCAVCAVLLLSAVSCGDAASGADTIAQTTSPQDVTTAAVTSDEAAASEVFTKTDLDSSIPDDAVAVDLSSGSVSITEAGSYILTGTLTDGSVSVAVAKTDKVRLIFSGASITCSNGAAVTVESADKVIITLADGTENSVTDGSSYADTAYNAAICSKDDLTINGGGSLTVTANYNNGVDCSNDLKITGGTITVSAPNNAVKGNDGISIGGGTITLTSGDDGLKSESKSDSSAGYFYMEAGTLSITAADDAITAAKYVTVTGGLISVASGGKTVNCDGAVNITDGCLTLLK
ncbi:MAG: carbohydrate-binding domain-containing protein [Eubacteriales bacterium]